MIKNLRHVVSVCTFATSTALGMVTGVVSAQSQSLRPDLDGLLLRHPRNGGIYWVDQGRVRPIHAMSVYNNLFNNGAFDNDINVTSIAGGPPLTARNRLVVCKEMNHPLSHTVYLLDQGKKRTITSPEAMERNSFNWNKIRGADCETLENIPNGPTIY